MKIGNKPDLRSIDDADVVEQGFEYEEEEVIIEGDEDDNDSPSKGKRKFEPPGQTKTLLIVGGVIILIVVLAISIFTMKKQNDEKEADRASALLEEEEAFSYTPSEISTLRANGYTGDEIEEFEMMSIPSDVKIDEAKAERKKLLDEEMKPIYDGRSDAYKQLEQDTWVGGAEFEVPDYNVDEWSSRFKELNCNYYKLDPRGYQLWVVVTPHNIPDMKLFVSVEPEIYARMYDSGNVVVDIDYEFNTVTKATVVTRVKNIRLSDN